MMEGKITIEAENKKAIFTFENDEINVKFEPELRREDTSQSACFITNIATILVKSLRG